MPNGYTSDIYDGKDGWDDLRSYLMSVGRGMSMAIMQRDEDPAQPVKLREVSEYSKRRVQETAAEVKRLDQLSTQQVLRESADEYREQRQRHVQADAAMRALETRYDLMIARVEAWEPEPIVQYVKDHALKYLRESKDFDCGRVYPAMPNPADFEPETWLERKKAEAKRSFEYATQNYQEEVERVAGFNLHIEAFHRSLPDG